MHFTKYNIATGKIEVAGECVPSDVPLQADAQHAVLPGVKIDGVTFYIVDGEPVPRPMVYPHKNATIAGNGLDELVIGNVPLGTGLCVDGASVGTIDDGELTYSSIERGDHFLWLQPPMPWQEQHIKVTVT